jgi:hypothetical protein
MPDDRIPPEQGPQFIERRRSTLRMASQEARIASDAARHDAIDALQATADTLSTTFEQMPERSSVEACAHEPPNGMCTTAQTRTGGTDTIATFHGGRRGAK